jgi:adenylate cyclase
MAGDVPQIEDLGSTNGTAVNGTPLRAGTSAAVHSGTKLKIGDVALTVTQR